MSFQNGHKHWISGWFDDRAETINPFSMSTVVRRMVSFVHYSHAELQDDDVVLLRVGNLYINFNLAEDYNQDTDVPNTVTVTEADSDESLSFRRAALSRGESFIEDGVVIAVCDTFYFPQRLGYAMVSIHW